MKKRIYLDHNSTTNISNTVKNEIFEVMNTFGNPSSIHLEGRKSRQLIERSREQIGNILDVDPENIIFTSSATEAASMILKDKKNSCSLLEHSCVTEWCENTLKVDLKGQIMIKEPMISVSHIGNSETGIIQDEFKNVFLLDVVQAIGKINFSFEKANVNSAIISAHKFGGPKGIGAALFKSDFDVQALIRGGGQERRLRSGTENILGIVGFAKALEISNKNIKNGYWEEISEIKNFLENEILNISNNSIIVGKNLKRLPNTSCIITPGWDGHNQVIQLDLAGFSVSAGSACSSGKMKYSNTLFALGYNKDLSKQAIRVSLGVNTKKSEVEAFLKEWSSLYYNWSKHVA